MDIEAIRDLKKEEGSKVDSDGLHIPYQDSLGIWTAGYGRNLETARFTEDEAQLWLIEDYEKAVTLAGKIPEYQGLSKNRKRILVAMCYQMGLAGVMKFRNMLVAIGREEWDEAGRQMLDSLWAEQTPARAKRMASRMVQDTWPA